MEPEYGDVDHVQFSQTQFQFPVLPVVPTPAFSAQHFKISVSSIQVLRSSVEPSAQPTEFIVTKSGLMNSLRVPQDGYVNIGRQQINEEGRRPNDIMLPASDRAISRCHCKIYYGLWFRGRELPNEFVAFLMAGHERLGQNSAFKGLPAHLFGYIYTFLKEPYNLWLIDLGSVCGTYVKVSHDIPVELRKSQCFLIGSDIIIEIDDVTCSPLLSLPSEGSEESLLQTMREVTQPSIRVTVGRIPDNEESTLNRHSQLFLAERPDQVFFIGRSNTCDIKLNDNTISRTQCRIQFTKEKWCLFDGLEYKPSVNGTWQSVCKKDRRVREESSPFLLQNGTQIKISDTVLQVAWSEETR